MDGRPALRRLGAPFPRVHADQQPLFGQHGPQRLAVRPAGAGGRLVRPHDARHEPRQSVPAALFPAVGRVVGRVRRPRRAARRHLSLQRKGPHERVVRRRAA